MPHDKSCTPSDWRREGDEAGRQPEEELEVVGIGKGTRDLNHHTIEQDQCDQNVSGRGCLFSERAACKRTTGRMDWISAQRAPPCRPNLNSLIDRFAIFSTSCCVHAVNK
jgi:hypothetical protein